MACSFAMASTPSPWSSLDISMPPSLTLDICLPILLRMSLYLLAPMGTSLCLPTLLRTSLLPFATQRTLLPLLLYGEPCSPLPPQRTSLSPLALWRTLLLPLVPWRTLLFPLASWKMLFSHLALPWTLPPGFVMIIAPILCSALDITPPFGYVEEMPYGGYCVSCWLH